MELINALPTNAEPFIGNGWLFSYGEHVIEREISAAYLIPGNSHYTSFKIVGWQPPLPAYQRAPAHG
jgi:hypothetical protein